MFRKSRGYLTAAQSKDSFGRLMAAGHVAKVGTRTEPKHCDVYAVTEQGHAALINLEPTGDRP